MTAFHTDNSDPGRDEERARALLGGLLGAIVANADASADGDDDRDGSSDTGSATAEPKRRARPSRKRKVAQLPKWNVILLDDDDHTYEYVIDMLGRLFAHSIRASIRMAREVDTDGRVIVYTTHKELAELKCDQIRKFGADPRIGSCQGSMRAFIEPAM